MPRRSWTDMRSCRHKCWVVVKRTKSDVTYHVTYHVRPHQPIIDQQGLRLRSPCGYSWPSLICLKAFMLGASTALWSSAFHLLITLFEKILRDIPCAPNLFKFTRVTSRTFAVCISNSSQSFFICLFPHIYNHFSISVLYLFQQYYSLSFL